MPPISAIVLAAGLSRRAGSQNKLLSAWEGSTVVATTVRTVLAAGFAGVTIVLGHERDLVRQALSVAADRVEWVDHAGYEEGVGSSIAAGVRTLPADHAVAVLLGDMPRVPLRHLVDLRTAFLAAPPPAILASGNGRWVGCPALFAPRYRSALLALTGDTGARSVLRAHASHVVELRVADPHWLDDEDLANL